VCLIKNEDLEAIPGRREDRPLTKFAGVVDAVVACGINFHYIK
jgi:hypothetical protein